MLQTGKKPYFSTEVSMKNFKRILSLLLASLMFLSLFSGWLVGTSIFADDETNVALNKPAYANGGKDTAANVTDGNAKTAWSTLGIPKYVEVDLTENYKISKIVVKLPSTANPAAYNLYGSTDGVNFDRLAAMTEPKAPASAGDTYTFETPVVYRVIRVMLTMSTKGSYSSSTVSEIEVYWN